MILFLISPSFEVFELIDPLARTNPAMPPCERWWIKCWTHAKFALPVGGRPYFHLTSSLSNSPFQSESLNGGLAKTKSALRSLCLSSWKLSPHWMFDSIPLMAIFILHSFQVVWLDSCPYTDSSPFRPPCSSTNFSDWTNIPPEPQAGSNILPL